MLSTANSLVPPQTFYRDVNVRDARYAYVKVLMSNIQSNSVTLTASSTTPIQFKMPYNTCFNMSESKFFYQINCSAPSASHYVWYYQNVFNLSNESNGITFETGNGLQLLNLTDPMKYHYIVGALNTPFKEYLTQDILNKPAPIFNSTYDLTNPSLAAIANNPNSMNYAGSSGFEPQYVAISASAGIPATAVATYDSNQFRLGGIKNTILSYDKDLYFGQNDMYLKINVSGYNKMMWDNTTNNSPASGATVTNSPTVTLQNVYLFLAVEQEPTIIDALVNAFNSGGIKLTIDYPISNKVNASGTSQSVVWNMTPAYGKYLKKIYYTISNSTEAYNTLLDLYNQNGAKITNYNTYLDSTILQTQLLVCASPTTNVIGLDDWRVNESQCRHSPIFSSAVYQKNWFHCDDFTDPNLAQRLEIPAENLIHGLPMERGVMWSIVATTANSTFVHEMWGIFTREILINSQGVQFV